jgi:hypothetical protein
MWLWSQEHDSTHYSGHPDENAALGAVLQAMGGRVVWGPHDQREQRSEGRRCGGATAQRRQIMTDSTNLSEEQAAQPNLDLTSLDRLVGTWAVSGEAEGTVVYEWTEGGFFLLQHVDLGGNKGLEVIGHEHKYGEDPSADIRSRYYGFSEGETLDYTYEIKDDTLTIWMGERNSPAYYEGTFSEDGNTLTGAWHYPGGGGYSTVSTRTAGT